MALFQCDNLCSVSDVPENRYYLSSCSGIIDDVVGVIADPVLHDDNVANTAICLLVHIAQTKKTHSNLFKEKIVKIFLSNLKKRYLNREKVFAAQMIL